MQDSIGRWGRFCAFVVCLCGLLFASASSLACSKPVAVADEPRAADAPADAEILSLAQVQERAVAAAPGCIGATVGIIVRDSNGDGSGNGRGMGSGVIVSAEGLILSAAHVVLTPGAQLIIILPDGTHVAGETLGVDHDVDAGMARITEPADYDFAPIAEQNGFAVGDWVLAVGHAGGIQTDRHPPLRLGRILHDLTGDDGEELFGNLATDCTIISGDSGGPLFDLGGRVIAIHSNIGMRITENRHVAINEYLSRWDAFLASEDLSTHPHREPIDPFTAEDLENLDEDGEPRNPADTDGDGEISDEEAARNVMRMNLYQQFSHVLTRDEIELLMSVAVASPNGGMRLNLTPQNIDEVQGVLDKLDAAQEEAARMPGPLPRRAMRYSRTGQQVNAMLDPVAQAAGASVVVVMNGDAPAGLGTVVGEGLVLTKASELDAARIEMDGDALLEDGIGVNIGGIVWGATVIGIDEATDLALLRVEKNEGMTSVQWADADAHLGDALGTLLISPSADGQPHAMGVVSVGVRDIPDKIQSIGNGNSAFLGVSGMGGGGSAVIHEVIEGGAAEAAGMLDGDAIIRIQELRIENHTDLVEAIGQFEPGTMIEIEVLREDEPVVLHATLQDATGKFDMEVDDNLPTAQLSRQAGAISQRRTNFPAAFTHDSIVWAGDCGGPVLGLDGKAIGINIARYGRTATYAIPADEVQRVIAELLEAEANDNANAEG